jgi:hypothetical protein
MLTNPTISKLHALNLMGMARAFTEQLERADYGSLAFEERLGLLVDREGQDRDNRRLERNLKAAKLRSNASIEDLDFHRPRGPRSWRPRIRLQCLHMAMPIGVRTACRYSSMIGP